MRMSKFFSPSLIFFGFPLSFLCFSGFCSRAFVFTCIGFTTKILHHFRAKPFVSPFASGSRVLKVVGEAERGETTGSSNNGGNCSLCEIA